MAQNPDQIPEADALVISLYDELRGIARREHFRAGAPNTLQPTALINEAYMKLQHHAGWHSRSHFLACAATAMRHILIDAARARLTAKRAAITDVAANDADDDDEIMRLGDALKALSTMDPNLARVVDCRFFAGYDEKETADIMGVSDRTVRRWWVQARAWIHRELEAA
ncbi:MAG: sigma-70 family RNA polymerase sigma factor [Sandarakinorhabdus sp.]|nr:sigma-70 family RNA polymerase sigma factor [Sandarakinorhabdus sp.]